MPRRTDPIDWMWSHAVDLVEQAGRMHGRFFRLTASSRAAAAWEPPADLFEDERELVIVVALPGVAAEAVEVFHEPGVLTVRAERAQPLLHAPHAVRQLEIPYGCFERRIALPPGRYETGTPELTHGCLILRLRKRA